MGVTTININRFWSAFPKTVILEVSYDWGGTPKSSILIKLSIVTNPVWGTNKTHWRVPPKVKNLELRPQSQSKLADGSDL